MFFSPPVAITATATVTRPPFSLFRLVFFSFSRKHTKTKIKNQRNTTISYVLHVVSPRLLLNCENCFSTRTAFTPKTFSRSPESPHALLITCAVTSDPSLTTSSASSSSLYGLKIKITILILPQKVTYEPTTMTLKRAFCVFFFSITEEQFRAQLQLLYLVHGLKCNIFTYKT